MCRIGLIVEYSRMQVPSLSRGCDVYAPRTKILEGRTICSPNLILTSKRALSPRQTKWYCAKYMLPKRRFWKDEQKRKSGFRRKHFSRVSNRFGLRTIEKCFLRNPDFLFCSFFQKSSFGEHKYICPMTSLYHSHNPCCAFRQPFLVVHIRSKLG